MQTEPTYIERMAAARYHRAPRGDPAPSQSDGASNARMLMAELERAARLEALIEECILNRWTRTNPKTIKRVEELGLQDYLGHIPASLKEMDLPKRGQVRYIRHSDLRTWHIIIWIRGNTVHRPLCNLVAPYPKHARGQSRRPRVSPYDSPVCRSCERRLEKLVAAGHVSTAVNGEIFGRPHSHQAESAWTKLPPEERKRLASEMMPRFSPV